MNLAIFGSSAYGRKRNENVLFRAFLVYITILLTLPIWFMFLHIGVENVEMSGIIKARSKNEQYRKDLDYFH